MLVLLSPTKTMKNVVLEDNQLNLPTFLDKTKLIYNVLKTFTKEDFQNKMKVNEKIALENINRMQNFKFDDKGIMAIKACDGILYKRFDVNSLSKKEFSFANDIIRIISAMYGILKPYDSIYPYRLEMQSKISVDNSKDIYDFWDSTIALELEKDNDVILNLCSKEYSKSFIPYLKNKEKLFNCEFLLQKDGKLKTQATLAKQARGLMARFIVKNQINDINLVKNFSSDGFKFSEENSNDNNLVFIKYS